MERPKGGFVMLWSKILDSSIWVMESKETRLVWITLLAMKNCDGIVQSSVVGLANRAKVSVDECKAALKVLLSPDPEDTSKVDGGIRIREIQGGWEIVNHDLYRFTTEAKREFWRQQKAEQRARAAGVKTFSELSKKQQKQFGTADKYMAAREEQHCEPHQVPKTEAEKGMTLREILYNRRNEAEEARVSSGTAVAQ